MNRNAKILTVLFTIIIIIVPVSLLSWIFLFGESPQGNLPGIKYPDLSISSHSVDDENLSFTISNQGEKDASGVVVVVEINLLGLILYDNSLSPMSLAIDENRQISINLTEFQSYFLARYTYSIAIHVDPEDQIEESTESNNFMTMDYIYLPSDIIFPNTYAYNSTIEYLGYAVQFNESQILLEDFLIISKGNINGYSLVNSTVLNSSTVLNNQNRINFALYGNQNLTLTNIWKPSITLILFDNSSASLSNCSINEIRSYGNNSIKINNSTLNYCTISGSKQDAAKLNINNNSKIEALMIMVSSELNIKSSLFNTFMCQSTTNIYEMKDYEINGKIDNSTIDTFIAFGQANILISNTNLTQANLMGNSKIGFQRCIMASLTSMLFSNAILNESQITSRLTYGIIISSGSVNITNGEIEGTYVNTTEIINSNVSSSSFTSISVNGTGELSITNFSSNVFLFDSAKLVIDESNVNSTEQYGCFLQDNSELMAKNCSFESLLAYGDAKIQLNNRSIAEMIFLNTSGEVGIIDSYVAQSILLPNHKSGKPSIFTNCTIDEFFVYPSSKVNLTNSTINNLYEGFILESDDIIIESSGISGPGNYINYIQLKNSICHNRTLKYITIKDDINVSINNNHDYLVIHMENGSLNVFNSSISSLQMKFDSRATINNCSFAGFDEALSQMVLLFAAGDKSIVCYDTSCVVISNNTKIPSQFGIDFYDYSEVVIENSYVEFISILSGAKLSASNCELSQIIINAYRPEEYSVIINHSTIEGLMTYSWNYMQSYLSYIRVGSIF